MTLTERIFYWSPRVLSIGFVLFLSLFALDVFSGPFEPAMLIGLLIHLFPSLVLLATVLIAWKFDLVGTVMFFGFAFWYVLQTGFDKPWSWYASIAVPAAVVGVLFFISWYQKRNRVRSVSPQPFSDQ